MKTQILKKHNLIVLAVFIALGIAIAIIMYKMVNTSDGSAVTRDSIFLVSFIFGATYFLAAFGWVQDMRWDAKREKELLREGDS